MKKENSNHTAGIEVGEPFEEERRAVEWWEEANPNIEIKETRARTFSIQFIEFLKKQLNSIVCTPMTTHSL